MRHGHAPELSDLQWQRVKDEFGAAVRECREFDGSTQYEWAEWLGVHQGTVSGWEKGRSLPRGRTLYVLAKYMGASIDYLFGVSRERHTPQHVARAKVRGTR